MDARVSFSLAYCSQRSRARARNGLRAVYRGNCHFNNTRAKEGEEGEGEDGRGVAKLEYILNGGESCRIWLGYLPLDASKVGQT